MSDIELYRAAQADLKRSLDGRSPKMDVLKEEGRKLAEQKNGSSGRVSESTAGYAGSQHGESKH